MPGAPLHGRPWEDRPHLASWISRAFAPRRASSGWRAGTSPTTSTSARPRSRSLDSSPPPR
eukprot:77097-Alexandrium_andersonii.AAC.1